VDAYLAIQRIVFANVTIILYRTIILFYLRFENCVMLSCSSLHNWLTIVSYHQRCSHWRRETV